MPKKHSANPKPSARFPLTSAAAEAIVAPFIDQPQSDKFLPALEEALRTDPQAVELLMLRARFAETDEEFVKFVRMASEAGMSKFRTETNDVSKCMPAYRLSLATSLMEIANYREAVGILKPALVEDPDDTQSCHFLLIEAMLRLESYEELDSIIEYLPFSPATVFAQALVAFRRDGKVESSEIEMFNACLEFPEIAMRLCGAQPLPEASADDAGEDDDEDDDEDDGGIAQYEAMYDEVARLLMPAFRDTPGAMQWTRLQLDDALRHEQEETGYEEADSDDDELDDDELDDFEEDDFEEDDFEESYGGDEDGEVDSFGSLQVYELQSLANECDKVDSIWHLIILKSSTYADCWLVLVFQEGQIRAFDKFEAPPTTEQLQRIVALAIVDPLMDAAFRPTELCVPDKATYNLLDEFAVELDIEIRVEQLDQEVLKIVEEFVENELLALEKDDDDFDPAEMETTLETIAELPVATNVWFYGDFYVPVFVKDGIIPNRTWFGSIVESHTELILDSLLTGEEPTAQERLTMLTKAMVAPKFGAPRRPMEIIVASKEIKADLNAIQSVPIRVGNPAEMESIKERMTEFLEFKSEIKPSLRKSPGVTDQALETFYQSAADFYRATPWKLCDSDRFFEVTCTAWRHPTWAACIMGQLGIERGIALYDNPEDALATLEDQESNRHLMNAAVVHYAEDFQAIAVDVWNMERFGWEIASDEAYPFVARLNKGKQFSACTAEDIQALTAVFQHAVEFITQPNESSMAFDVAGGTMELHWLN